MIYVIPDGSCNKHHIYEYLYISPSGQDARLARKIIVYSALSQIRVRVIPESDSFWGWCRRQTTRSAHRVLGLAAMQQARG
jgi:hypothetical protein